MRAIIAALAVLGGGFIVAALGVSVAGGDGSEVDWLLVGPLPFYAVGVTGFLRRPGQLVVWWLVGLSTAFAAETALGDVFLPLAESHWGSPPHSPRRSRWCDSGPTPGPRLPP